jgi:two-component system response regulator FixJ
MNLMPDMEGGADAAGKRRLILIVDDDPDVRDSLVVLLEQLGYLCITAASGHEALEVITVSSPDLVLADVFMPEGDGIELQMQLQARRPDLPVIVMSGGGDMVRLDMLYVARNLGAVATLTKPFTRPELEQALDRIATLRAETDEQEAQAAG